MLSVIDSVGFVSSRERYFVAAYALLGEGDPAAITIDALCRTVGATSGSFYHHFGSQQGFVRALADDWYERSVEHAAKQAAQATSTLEARRLLRRSIRSTEHHVEAAMRAWARTSPTIAEAVRMADERRREVARSILGSLAPDATSSELDAYTDLVQLVFIGAQAQQPDRASVTINRALDAFVALLPMGTSESAPPKTPAPRRRR